MILKTLLSVLALTFFLSVPAKASDSFGLSMVGAPKYSKNDTHLEYANPDAPKGGTLKQAAIGSFDTLNPFSIKGKSAQALNLVTDRLMGRVWDEPFTLYPLIAENADVPEDRSSITFTLDPRAVFHDKTPITADDVLFSYEILKEKGRPNMRQVYQLATAEKLGERQVKFAFGEGYDRETMMIFAMMPVLSKAYWSDKDFDTTTLQPPLGNGPYKISDVEVGKKITYKRVEDYWARDSLTNKGHHNFDEIIYEYYRDDTVAFESFKKGNLDLRREGDAGKWNNAYNIPQIIDGTITQEELEHGRPDKVRGFIFNTRRAPFDDIKLREALSLLFNFEWLNKNLFYGQYEQVNSFYPNTDLAREISAAEKKPLNMREKMRKSLALLKEAGWVIKDRKLVNAETGTPMQFEILLDNPTDEKMALFYAKSLESMGIKATTRVLDSAAYRGRMSDYDFDMTLYFWHSTLSPGTEQYLYWSCEAANQPSRWNYAGVCDPEIDALTKAIPTAKTRAELVANTQKLDQKLWEGHYFVPLYYNPVDFVAYLTTLERPELTPLYGMVVETWWMKPSEAAE